MGLFRRKDERAIPKPGTPEFDQAVEGTALPDDQSVSMGESGWAKPESEPAGDETAAEQSAGDGARPEAEQPDQSDSAEKPKRRERFIRGMAQRVPNQGGFGAGIPGPKKPKK
jgi:hypothetical protein